LLWEAKYESVSDPRYSDRRLFIVARANTIQEHDSPCLPRDEWVDGEAMNQADEFFARRRARIKWICFWCVGAYALFLVAALVEGFIR
jgi:hypothetical protein